MWKFPVNTETVHTIWNTSKRKVVKDMVGVWVKNETSHLKVQCKKKWKNKKEIFKCQTFIRNTSFSSRINLASRLQKRENSVYAIKESYSSRWAYRWCSSSLSSFDVILTIFYGYCPCSYFYAFCLLWFDGVIRFFHFALDPCVEGTFIHLSINSMCDTYILLTVMT